MQPGFQQFLISELEQLRSLYVASTPRQRAHVSKQRLANAHANPNRIVTHVSAVEALARSLAMHSHAKSKAELKAIYPRFRTWEAHNLVAECFMRRLGKKPAEVLGRETWSTFRLAVNYRNLLVHECTYLNNEKFEPLFEACAVVFAELEAIAEGRKRVA